MIWSVEGTVGQSLLSSLSKVNYIVASPKAGAFAGTVIQESSGAAQLTAGLLWIVDHLGMCSLEKGGSEGTGGLSSCLRRAGLWKERVDLFCLLP